MKQLLEERRQRVEAQFETLKNQKQQKEDELNEINTEIARLQGDHRTITSLLEEPEEPSIEPSAEPVAENISTEAHVIDVKEVEDAES